MEKSGEPGPHRQRMRQQLGRFGEQVVVGYLTRRGYTIIAQNWRCQAGEIDLIAQQGPQLVFVEVRTRHAGSPTGPTPEESITPTKQERLTTLAYTYLQTTQHPEPDLWHSWRIDVVVVEVGGNGRVVRIEHIPNAIEQV